MLKTLFFILKNIGYHLCIDETALSKGELYTILTNRDKHGRKGTIVAIVKGTKAEDVINVSFSKIDADKRNQVKEITLDMAGSMQKNSKTLFSRGYAGSGSFPCLKVGL